MVLRLVRGGEVYTCTRLHRGSVHNPFTAAKSVARTPLPSSGIHDADFAGEAHEGPYEQLRLPVRTAVQQQYIPCTTTVQQQYDTRI